ncbi:MAG TPA: hypothetical protein VMF65_19925 [Acidimicrobiales bacterium]|nr:hypothetical protein [Acidimicrobiales bacterium]
MAAEVRPVEVVGRAAPLRLGRVRLGEVRERSVAGPATSAGFAVINGCGSVVVLDGRATVVGATVVAGDSGEVARTSTVVVDVTRATKVVVLAPVLGPGSRPCRTLFRCGRTRPPWSETARPVLLLTVVAVAVRVCKVAVVAGVVTRGDGDRVGITNRTGTVVLTGPVAATKTLLGVTVRGTGGVATCAARALAAVTAAAPAATWVVVTKAWPAPLNLARKGTSATHETGPTTHRSRPIDTFRSALTIAGSNWLPAQRVSSWRAAAGLRAFLYERTAVMTSKASATATIRAPREMASPDRPKG